MDAKITPTCRHCGSREVTRDAVVRWCGEKQDWEVSGVFDNADCDHCGGETKLVDTPFKEIDTCIRCETEFAISFLRDGKCRHCREGQEILPCNKCGKKFAISDLSDPCERLCRFCASEEAEDE